VNSSSGKTELLVAEEYVGQRLDRFLSSQLTDLSRTRIQSLMENGLVRVSGAAMKPSYRVESGDLVTVEIPEPPAAAVEAEPIALDVLYEDSDMAVINKPAGMIIHPGAGAQSGTMVAALLSRFGGMTGLSSVGGPMRPGIVHRLDKETSGAVVIARTDAAHKKLVEEFQNRQVQKTYVALLHGKLKGESGTIDLPVARDLRRRSRMTARRREGREARTDWRIRLRADGFTFVEASLHTGRTHQIRVHFSTIGCPVVGDTIYGAPQQERVAMRLLPPLERNFLHAARLAFVHPTTRKNMEFRAPLPPELVEYGRMIVQAASGDSRAFDASLKEYL
jgi:23S rRNA pseudouridine1911/1915/1917 synthase